MHFTQSNTGYVYFIQSINGGPIKIGSAFNVQRRLKQLQTGNPDMLILLHATTGGKRFEFFLHSKFEKYNKRDEWFYPEDEILKFISELKNEDEKFGLIHCLKDFVKDKKYNLSSIEIDTIDHLLNTAIIPYTSIEQKSKYWHVMDDYLGYLKEFPFWLVCKRKLNCYVYEGRQDKDRIMRKKHNVVIKNF